MPFLTDSDPPLSPARRKEAEDLLAGLIAQQPELGLIGGQLVFLLMAAGIEPTYPTTHTIWPGMLSNSPH